MITPSAAALVQDVLVNLTRGFGPAGGATKIFQDWLLSVEQAVPAYNPFIVTAPNFGASGGGTRDDTSAIQKAIDQAAVQGGTVLLPPGVFSVGVLTFPAGDKPITMLGQGPSTIVQRRYPLPTGKGLLDILGSNVTLRSFVLEGTTTTPVGLRYNQDFLVNGGNDPMADSLTKDTSIWWHGPASRLTLDDVEIRHTGGYALLADCQTAGLSDLRLINCFFHDNRPNLFGIPGGEAIYGSWGGGVFVRGDGRGINGRILKGLFAMGCRFLRNDGNCLWSHLLGLDELHEDFRVLGCYFRDTGLDGILMGGVLGGAVLGNVLRRIGYTTLTDSDDPIPRWLPGVNASAIDSSGLVKSVVYALNSILSCNGGGIDMDGHGHSVVSGNVIRTPYPDEPEYDEDRIAMSGPTGAQPEGYGINIGNTSKKIYGASHLTITGNSLINLHAGAMRLFATRRCTVSGNTIIAPDVSGYPPITMGNVSDDPAQRCGDNKVVHNHIHYNPPIAAPAVFEAETYSAFTTAEVNSVFGNTPISPPGTVASEFQKSPSSGSMHYSEQPWPV